MLRPFYLEEEMTTAAETATPPQQDSDLQRLYPGVFLPSYWQALELAAVELERQSGAAAAERLWNMNTEAEQQHLLHEEYGQAVAEHLAHWGAENNAPVAERLALIFSVRELDEEDDVNLPAGWNWPVCDDCTLIAYDLGQRTAVQQAAFMQDFGKELPDHLCEMALGPEDRGRNSCACGCQRQTRHHRPPASTSPARTNNHDHRRNLCRHGRNPLRPEPRGQPLPQRRLPGTLRHL